MTYVLRIDAQFPKQCLTGNFAIANTAGAIATVIENRGLPSSILVANEPQSFDLARIELVDKRVVEALTDGRPPLVIREWNAIGGYPNSRELNGDWERLQQMVITTWTKHLLYCAVGLGTADINSVVSRATKMMLARRVWAVTSVITGDYQLEIACEPFIIAANAYGANKGEKSIEEAIKIVSHLMTIVESLTGEAIPASKYVVAVECDTNTISQRVVDLASVINSYREFDLDREILRLLALTGDF